MAAKIVNFIALQVAWFACILGATKGYFWLGPVFVGLFLVGHVWFVATSREREIRFILVVSILGAIADSLQKRYGVLFYTDDYVRLEWLAPVWIISLWAIFATGFTTSLQWMHRRYLVGALFGFIGGPLSYLGGVKFGAVSFKYSQTVSMLVLGLVWGTMMVLLLRLVEVFGLAQKNEAVRQPEGVRFG